MVEKLNTKGDFWVLMCHKGLEFIATTHGQFVRVSLCVISWDKKMGKNKCPLKYRFFLGKILV